MSRAAAARTMDEEAEYLETARADRSVWLMKCPPVVSRAGQAASASSSDAAKVVLSLDLLRQEERPEEPTLQASTHNPLHPAGPFPVIRL
jgi:transcription initiation factor TFIIF subunit beta